VHCTTSCKQSSAPEDGRNYRPKHVELIVIINKICICGIQSAVYIIVSAMHGRCTVTLTSNLNLLRRTQHGFIFNCALHVCYMFRPVLRPSSGTSIQKSSKGRYLHTYSLNYSPTHSLTHSLTYLLTPWCRVLLEKLTGLQLVKKYNAINCTGPFFTVTVCLQCHSTDHRTVQNTM